MQDEDLDRYEDEEVKDEVSVATEDYVADWFGQLKPNIPKDSPYQFCQHGFNALSRTNLPSQKKDARIGRYSRRHSSWRK